MWRRVATRDDDLADRPFSAGPEERTRATTVLGTPAPDVGLVQPECSKLQSAIVDFRASHGTGVFSAKRTIDPLLDLWSLASAVDRSVARPIEVVLVSLVERSIVTGEELASCIGQVEEAVARLASSPDGVLWV